MENTGFKVSSVFFILDFSRFDLTDWEINF